MAPTDASQKENLHGIVDIGSNGIRSSISDLTSPTSRTMPTLFQDREGISLYDAQIKSEDGSRIPIPEEVVNKVVAALKRFKVTCEDFGVLPGNNYVLATEATRTATNGDYLRRRIKEATGWETRLLSKEEEGRIGALGVASSFASVEGLVMDLGGGSTQITWMVARDGTVKTSPKGSMSFPYGAAALLRRLEDARACGPEAETELRNEIKSRFEEAYHSLEIPDDLLQIAEREGGFDLYLCGGGFRGWGYVLMSQSHIDPYPIPIINGFKANKADFKDTINVQKAVLDTKRSKEKKIFGVSKRRASQVPAVAFLVSALVEAIPAIKDIQFCQGGVREGFFFDTLPPEIRSEDPLVVATSRFATKSAEAIAKLLIQALPTYSSSQTSSDSSSYPPPSFTPNLMRSLSNLMFTHSSSPRESRSASALHSTTTGLISSAHGLSHENRALLALILCERWSPGSDLAPSEKPLLLRLQQSVSMQEAWWCRYIGQVAALVGDIYPAGVIRESGSPRIGFQARRVSGRGKKGMSEAVELVILAPRIESEVVGTDMLMDARSRIEKVGKKKNWTKAENRLGVERVRGDWGMKVDVNIEKSL